MPKVNSIEENEFLDKILDLAAIEEFAQIDSLLGELPEQSSFAENDCCLSTILMTLAQHKKPELAKKFIPLIDVASLKANEHYEILSGVINFGGKEPSTPEIVKDLLSAGLEVTYKAQGSKDILMVASQQISRERPDPHTTEIVRAIIATKQAPQLEGELLSQLALFMIDQMDDRCISPRDLEEKEIFRNQERMVEILRDFRTRSRIADGEYEVLRNQLNANFGTAISALAEDELTFSASVKMKSKTNSRRVAVEPTTPQSPAKEEIEVASSTQTKPAPKPTEPKAASQKGKSWPSCAVC